MILFKYFQLIRNMGLQYISFRVLFSIKCKTGLIRFKFPINPPVKKFISAAQWDLFKSGFVFNGRESIKTPNNQSQNLKDKANRILANSYCFFNSIWFDLGNDYDWVTNPDTGFKYDSLRHWSKINDFNKDQGDIKYVWEKSRFSYLLTILRYDYHYGLDHSEFVFNEILDWIDKNPVNCGPNWKCSQEMSIRIINWTYCLNYYSDSIHFNDEKWFKIQNAIYWQLHHIFNNINFSRIAVRNNHAITETMVLALSNILFPFIPETVLWSEKGRRFFEEEIEYQIYPDGAFIQNSLNYHRVLIQLLAFAIQISENGKKPFSQKVYDKAYLTLEFIVQFVQDNGRVPNYGNNDGSLFFPLTDNDYNDFRPQLNSLHLILTGQNLYSEIEDFIFPITKSKFAPLTVKYGIVAFKESGYYLFRSKQHFTFIRCCQYRDRPGHADNLHIDIWVNGENILRDAGSYKYNASTTEIDFFFGTKSHNTVVINNSNQMLKGSRFLWYYWPDKATTKINEDDFYYYFTGSVYLYKQLGGAVHSRKLKIDKRSLEWEIIDEIYPQNRHIKLHCQQTWNLIPNSKVEFLSISDGHIVKPIDIESFFSDYYGVKENQIGKSFSFANKIKTTFKINA